MFSTKNLKYDVAECSPWLLSMECYPSLFLDAAECSPQLVSMEWYPSLFLKFFNQLVLPCIHTCSSEIHGTIPTSLLFFAENVFTPLVSLLFLECKLHCGTCSLALKARAEAVLTTILHMSFDVVYYLFLCVLLLSCQPGLLSMKWYPFLFLKFFRQLIFSCRHVFFRDTWHHPYFSTCFCGERFYSLVSLLVWSATALWQFQS